MISTRFTCSLLAVPVCWIQSHLICFRANDCCNRYKRIAQLSAGGTALSKYEQLFKHGPLPQFASRPAGMEGTRGVASRRQTTASERRTVTLAGCSRAAVPPGQWSRQKMTKVSLCPDWSIQSRRKKSGGRGLSASFSLRCAKKSLRSMMIFTHCCFAGFQQLMAQDYFKTDLIWFMYCFNSKNS